MKLIKSFLALLAVLPCAAIAQTPPDVGTYSARTATYASGSTPNVLGDNSNAKGGTAPAFSTVPEPTDPTPTVPVGWIVGDNLSACLTVTSGNVCGEKKSRFSANSTHFLYDDPIRNWGQPGAAHCHEFFGNKEVNAYSTRLSLRTRTKSSAAGGPANLTGYWEPCVRKTIGGKLYAIPSDINIIYYTEQAPQDGSALVDILQPLHLKLRFVAGTNMDDPDDAVVKAEIATANAQSGTSGRYTYIGNGFHGYQCVLANGTIALTSAGQTEARSFRLTTGTADSDDPWYVGAVHTCVDGSQILTYGDAPECWDGWNVWSPTGYRHFRYAVSDGTIGLPVCPNGWYKVPSFVLKTYHRTHGWDDYKTWSLASDAMMSAKLTALGTPRTVLPGESFHFDWMNGWNTATLNKWLSYCMGIGSNVPHQCDYSTISATERLISDSAAPDGSRNPQVNLFTNIDTNDVTKLKLIETTRTPTHRMKGM
jgi:hypothetical protein